MAGSRLKTWLHRIGYVTTVIVLAEATFIGYRLFDTWRQNEHRAAIAREETRTHEGPLNDPYAVAALARTPPVSEMSGDGFRFVVMPSFYEYWYVVSVHLADGSDQAQGVFELVQPERKGDDSSDKFQLNYLPLQTFIVPKADYAATMKRIDALSDGWPGDSHGFGCFDGTPVAFERVRAKRITSGAGNESCSARYHALNLEIRRMLKRDAAQLKFPVGEDWMDDPAPAPPANRFGAKP